MPSLRSLQSRPTCDSCSLNLVRDEAGQTACQKRAQMAGNRTQAFRDIAAIRRDPNLSLAEKNCLTARIREQLEETLEGHTATLSRL